MSMGLGSEMGSLLPEGSLRVEWVTDPIDETNETNCSLIIYYPYAITGASWNYTVEITGASGTPIVRNGSTTAPSGQITISALDCSVFPDGTVRASYFLKDPNNAITPTVISDVAKDTTP